MAGAKFKLISQLRHFSLKSDVLLEQFNSRICVKSEKYIENVCDDAIVTIIVIIMIKNTTMINIIF